MGNMKSRNLMQCSESVALVVDTNHLNFIVIMNALSMQGLRIGRIVDRGVLHLMHKLEIFNWEFNATYFLLVL
jgi:hypothetical protein